MGEVAFFFENAQQCSDCLVRGSIGNGRMHLGGRCRATTIDRVHDLTFSPAQLRGFALGHSTLLASISRGDFK